ncbi:MAG: DUF2442 domain-containing protein [Gammaproteobacteria bacterium]
MTISANEFAGPAASHVSVTDATIDVELADGCSLSVPISWYPRLEHATQGERDRWTLTGSGLGMHWPDIDEDISVEALVAGTPSKESQASPARWLESRQP